jgi:hypothetical protein
MVRSSKDHRQAIGKAKAERNGKGVEKQEFFMPDDSSDSRSTWGVINVDEAPDPAELLKHPSSVTHLSFRELNLHGIFWIITDLGLQNLRVEELPFLAWFFVPSNLRH